LFATFNCHRSSIPDPAMINMEPISSESAPVHGPHGTVLVVDDNAAVLNVICQILARVSEVRISATCSPTHALEIFESHADEIDLVFTDLRMPEMSGVQLAESIHALRPNVPIVAVSATESESEGCAAINERIPKPFSAQALLATVDRYCPTGN
jgi:two-component system cell cycle sensor histidine kinase/response regulator CckA